MRIIQEYYFKTGTKIPFSELPSLIHSFFKENGTSYNTFLYYFSDLAWDWENSDLSKKGVLKLHKDCPQLGEINFLEGKRIGAFDTYFISNIASYAGNTEEYVLPLMKKIHKYYGMSDNDLYFFDADFFGKVIPWGRDTSIAEEKYKDTNVPCDYNRLLSYQPYGSGVRIHRDCFDTFLILSVDVLIDGKMYDADDIAEIMKKHLSGIKYRKSTSTVIPDEERRETENKIDIMNNKAKSLIQSVGEYYEKIMTSADYQNKESSRYSIAPTVKKYAKQYGYEYNNVYSGVYYLEKRTKKGPIIRLVVDSGPSRYSVDFILRIVGIEYEHQLFYTMQTPTNQESFDLCALKFFQLAVDFENRFYPMFSEIFPPVPKWFIAVD